MPEKETTTTETTPKVEDAPTTATSTGITKEQVEELLAKARREEKDKLYPQIEELSSTVKDVQEALRAEREEKEKIRKEAENKADEERRSQLSTEQLLQEGMKKIEEQLASEKEERAKLARQIEEDRRREKLAAYRAQKIGEAKGDILPELVRGDSEEEIDAAVTLAKARYAEIVEQMKETLGDNVKHNMPRPASPDTAPIEEQELLDDIDSLDIDVQLYAKDKSYRAEIDKKREAIQSRVAGAYARSLGQA